jgi:plasmid stabilization system protein ParE
MGDKPVVFHPEALTEAEAAIAWYQARSTHAAELLFTELEAAIDAVIQAPSRWPVYDEACRRFPLRRFPYLLIYREKEKVIEVLAVAHGRRRPGYWRKRASASGDAS